jgi:spore coat polysaccharide biosynthesis protein SpsF
MGSSRLRGKVLRDIDGKTLLERLVERLRQVKGIDDIIIATTTKKEDDPIIIFCEKNNISYFRGSENDVLRRYLEAANCYGIYWIIRVCADSPLTDPDGINEVIKLAKENENADVIHNKHKKGYPIGTGVELISLDALKVADIEAKENHHREHVVPYFFENPDKFTILGLEAPKAIQRLNFFLTVDYKEDLELLNIIFSHFRKNNIMNPSLREIISFLDNNPEVAKINQHLHEIYER